MNREAGKVRRENLFDAATNVLLGRFIFKMLHRLDDIEISFVYFHISLSKTQYPVPICQF